MKVERTAIPEVVLLEPKAFPDERGLVFESYNRRVFAEATGVAPDFVQDNRSISKKNVLRGLHYQVVKPQGKLIQVLRGEIFDVAVDLRRASPSFGKWVGARLSEANRRMIWIPPGFAHGLLALSDVDVLYKMTELWMPEHDRTIAWDDPAIGIQWPVEQPILSGKDKAGKLLRQAELFSVRILLTGCHGQVGWELARVLPALGEVIATDRTALDLFYSDLVRQAVRNARPDIIVNAAAYTAVDRAESEADVAMEVNGVAPGVLAEEAKRVGALLVHYSTDYVFDGDKRGAYVEDDAPNPLNAYGRTKLEGERRIAQSGCRHLILRTSWVYAARGKNFYLTIRRKAASGETLRVVDDQIGAPTSAAFIAEYTASLIQLQATGLLHLVPSGSTSWYGFAREILARSGSQARLEPIRSGEYPAAARRPANSTLDNSKAEAILQVSLPPWESALERCMKEWKPA